MNEKGPLKTLKQLKYKITGTSPTYSPYFEDFDEVLGTRDVISNAFAREVGVLNQDDISHDEGKGNLILFRIYFSQGRERYSELKVVHIKVFAKPVLVNLHKKLW